MKLVQALAAAVTAAVAVEVVQARKDAARRATNGVKAATKSLKRSATAYIAKRRVPK